MPSDFIIHFIRLAFVRLATNARFEVNEATPQIALHTYIALDQRFPSHHRLINGFAPVHSRRFSFGGNHAVPLRTEVVVWYENARTLFNETYRDDWLGG